MWIIAEIGNSAAPQQRHSLASTNVLQRPTQLTQKSTFKIEYLSSVYTADLNSIHINLYTSTTMTDHADAPNSNKAFVPLG